jgi:hypothetical protein
MNSIYRRALKETYRQCVFPTTTANDEYGSPHGEVAGGFGS